MTALVAQLKEAGQDYEYYPTTDAMIRAVAKRVRKPASILDIGAGDGRVLEQLARLTWKDSEQNNPEDWHGAELYAIEKAGIHIENMPADIRIVGTDFENQTLIDKQVDLVFSNPPYSQYEAWACKIIKEAYCNEVYLILPQRWKENKAIEYALEHRKATAKVIYSGDFSNAERKARANIDIIEIRLATKATHYNRERTKPDPFDAWFDATYPQVATMKTEQDHETPKARINGDLLKGYSLVDRLCELYAKELAKMNADYKALCEISPSVFKTVGVTASQVRDSLQSAIKGLKNLYWEELFDHLDKIKERLTHASREAFLKKISGAVNVDFTHENVYAVVLWVLKNANQYMDGQLCELFTTLTHPDHIKNYKSNQKTWEKDGWRFRQSGHTHYTLDYRIITHQHQGIKEAGSWSTWDFTNNLHNSCHHMLDDIMTVANNLGYLCQQSSTEREWFSGDPQLFKLAPLAKGQTLMRVRAFKNGNLHLQLDQHFIKALNIEASRLLGWIRTPREASEEMGIDFDFCAQHFKSHLCFTPMDCKRLTA